MTDETGPQPKKLRGFALLSPAARREVSARGGRAVPSEARPFSRSSALASRAGLVGGKISKRPPGKAKDAA